jgi:hypothetical protein
MGWWPFPSDTAGRAWFIGAHSCSHADDSWYG